MAKELQEFSSGWHDRFPDDGIPDLSFLQVLSNGPPDPDLLSDALINDTKTLNDRKQRLTEELNQVNYSLTWIRKRDFNPVYEHMSRGGDDCEKRSVGRQSSLKTPPSTLRLMMRRGSDPSPLTFDNGIRSPSPTGRSLTKPIDFRGRRGSDYENWTPVKSPSSPIYDIVPPPRKRVIHSEEFQDTLTKFCDKISPEQGRAILKSLGGEADNDSVDLPKMLLRNKMVDESDLSPLLNALGDNGLAHFNAIFKNFLKRESPDGEENEDIYIDVDACRDMSSTSDPPPIPSSPRPDRPESFTKTLFRVCNTLTVDQALSILHHLGEKNIKKNDLANEGKVVALLLMNDHVNVANIDRLVEALEKENLHSLGEDIKKSLKKFETKVPFPHVSPRRGSLDSGTPMHNTSLVRGARVRGQNPLRGRSHTESADPGKPAKLLNLIHRSRLTRSYSHEGPLTSLEKSQHSRFIDRGAASDSEERDSRSSCPVRSPISPQNVFQFVIKIIEDYKPPDKTNHGKSEPADYKHFALIRGQYFDVIGTWRFEYIARNKKGEIGLVSKDKCEVLNGVNPILWGKDWFLDCHVRHSTLELLKDAPIGTFFFRECHSKPGDLVLSVKLFTSPTKHQIIVNKACYELMGKSFPSLDTLLTFYKENSISAGNGVFLTEPLQHEKCK